jgi:hypothetical protein
MRTDAIQRSTELCRVLSREEVVRHEPELDRGRRGAFSLSRGPSSRAHARAGVTLGGRDAVRHVKEKCKKKKVQCLLNVRSGRSSLSRPRVGRATDRGAERLMLQRDCHA